MEGRPSRRLWSAAILLISSAALVTAGQGSEDSGISSIESALRQGQDQHALEMAQAQLKSVPNQLQLLTLEGIAYSALGRNREALAAFQKALLTAPNSLPALEGAAQLEFNSGDDGAEALLQRIVRIVPEEPTSHAMLATIVYKRHDCRAAIEHFQKAAAVIDREPIALTEYGACLLEQGRSAEAVTILQQALAVRPDDPRLRYNLGVAQQEADQNKEAIETFKPLLDEAHPAADVLDIASAAYEETGNTPEAVRLLRMALISNPKELKYYMDFTALALKHSSSQVGLDIVNIGMKELPNEAALYVARGVLKVELSQFEDAEVDFETADRLDPMQTSGAIGAGMAQMQQHDPERALATAEAQLKSHPEDYFLQFIKASALLESDPAPGSAKFKQAMNAVHMSLAAKPGFALARNLLAGMYLSAGDFAKAEAECRAVLAQNPDDQKAIYHLIQALRDQRRDPKNEIPELSKRMAKLLDETKNNETSANRYQLYEPESDKSSQPH